MLNCTEWAKTIDFDDVITLVRAEKGQKVNWAHIIFNSMCNELDRWYKYVK
jgi:hypothetical protein